MKKEDAQLNLGCAQLFVLVANTSFLLLHGLYIEI